MAPPPNPISIRTLCDVASLAALAADARADGSVIVDRLIQEWNDGRNRFDQPGERAYLAATDGRVCGVCGLNRDPFAGDASVGRVRRLYVALADRRRGVGSAILSRLLADAYGTFDSLHLRTRAPNACAFYEAIGFERVADGPTCTHRRRVN